jgi:hypothetical protein
MQSREKGRALRAPRRKSDGCWLARDVDRSLPSRVVVGLRDDALIDFFFR